MPKPTFLHLSAAKRETIIALASAEFAAHPYALASLSRVVERAGIAKGSIYQYFENKQDLYLFILEQAVQQQLALLQQLTPPKPGLDVFALLRWQMGASVQVGLAAPLLTRLLYRATTDELPFRAEVERRLKLAGEEHLRSLLAAGLARGEIDPSVDLELAAAIVRALGTSVRDLLLRRMAISLEAASVDVSLLDGPEVEQLYDQAIQILRSGIGSRPELSRQDNYV